MIIEKYIEDKNWRPSVIEEIQKCQYTSIIPNTDITIRNKHTLIESIVEEEIIEDLEELEEIDDDFEEFEEIDDIENKVSFEVIKDSYCVFKFELYPNWVQVGKYLIPENKFREIILQKKRIHEEFPKREQDITCLLKGYSTRDILLQKDLLGAKYPIPMKITKQLESEIKRLNQKERKSFGHVIKSSNLSEVDWNFMTLKKIEFIAKSLVSFSKEESRLSLKKLKSLEKQKIENEAEIKREEVRRGEWAYFLDEDPKNGAKFLDRIKNPISPFFYKRNGFTIRSPKNYMELYNEGLRMRNCIGKLHLSRIAEDREIPLFLERKRVIVAHLLLNSADEIKEVRMKYNRNPNKKIEEFVDEFAKKFDLELEYKNQYGYGNKGFKEPFD